MGLKWKSRIIVFIFSFLVWGLITSFTDIQEIIAGLIVALVISSISGGILLNTGRSFIVSKLLYIFIYIGVLAWEMLKANFNVAFIVINPMLPIKPGFIKIKTELEEDSSLTVLANSITLTPGTLTVDIDKEISTLYIHCIKVPSIDPKECTRLIGKRFEPILRRFMR